MGLAERETGYLFGSEVCSTTELGLAFRAERRTAMEEVVCSCDGLLLEKIESRGALWLSKTATIRIASQRSKPANLCI